MDEEVVQLFISEMSNSLREGAVLNNKIVKDFFEALFKIKIVDAFRWTESFVNDTVCQILKTIYSDVTIESFPTNCYMNVCINDVCCSFIGKRLIVIGRSNNADIQLDPLDLSLSRINTLVFIIPELFSYVIVNLHSNLVQSFSFNEPEVEGTFGNVIVQFNVKNCTICCTRRQVKDGRCTQCKPFSISSTIPPNPEEFIPYLPYSFLS